MELQRNLEILGATHLRVGGVTLRDGELSMEGQAARALSTLKRVRVRLPEPRVGGCITVVALLMAVGCGGGCSQFGWGAAACGASFAVAPLVVGLYGAFRGRELALIGADEASWPLPADVDREEIELFGERLNRDVEERGKPRQSADVLFTERVPTSFPVIFGTIEPIPLEEARKTKVGDAAVEARIAVATAAWRVSFASSSLLDVVKWGTRHNAIFALRDAEGAPAAADPLDTFVARLDPKPAPEAVERRRRTRKRLALEGLRMPPAGLPFLPAALVRTPAAVAERARVAFLISMAAQEQLHTGKVERLRGPLYELGHALSPSERAFVAAPDRPTAEPLAWRLEAVRVFAWALGWLPDAPPSTAPWEPGPSEAELLGALHEGKAGEVLLSAEQLTDALDYVYCARWIVVDARLKGQTPAGLHPGVLLEQHRALGWLVDSIAWDDVDLST